ncbi:hypothetical protein HII31_00362 [Pseudocercospora fuligena]|uniref:Uncharacterized protein n=1 Tax=Pseudocercospora fuligena TaxID=685502 RepID=A0A8H6RXG0_9PEZI|nr:hypothetical protein HII31_00362 [Pseudocercospora fuligena]
MDALTLKTLRAETARQLAKILFAYGMIPPHWRTVWQVDPPSGRHVCEIDRQQVVPLIAKLFQDGNITDSYHLMDSYGIPQNKSSEVYMKWPAISGCFDEWCKDPSRDGCNHYNESFSLLHFYDPSENGWNADTFAALPWPVNACEGINAEINPDIGGIGVFVGYVMQVIIVLLFWATWHYTEHCARYIYWLFYIASGRQCREAWTLAKRRQERRRSSDFRESLVDALHEFHKAQCFFVLAVQVACLIALKNPDYLAATSWQQFWNNVGILFDLSFGGCLLVLFVLLILRRCGKRDTFTLAVSIASVGLAATTWFMAWGFRNNALKTLQTHIHSDGISECGNIAPTQYCYFNNWSFANWISSKACEVFMSVFALVTLICMISDQIRIFPNSTNASRRRTPFQVFRERLRRCRWLESYENFIKKRRHVSWLAKVHLNTGPNLIDSMRFFILVLVETAFIWLLILLLNDYRELFLPANYIVLNLEAWTLGQVLAVTIWLPLLFEWTWNVVVGVYHWVRKPDGNATSMADEEKMASDGLGAEAFGYERINKRPEMTTDEISV